MAKGSNSPEPFDEETYHKQQVWEGFLSKAVEAGNKAIDWFELADYVDDETVSESKLEQVYNERWQSAGDIVVAAYNFLWPEIESLAVKLGVPFEPEIFDIESKDY